MRRIARLGEDDLEALLPIVTGAFTRSPPNTQPDHEAEIARLHSMHVAKPDAGLYGAWDNDVLMGGMYLHDFTMNLHGARVKGAGVGMVAVALVHKKQGVAKDLISFFVRRAREQDMPVAMLYPFRPDFYHKMGFGWGTQMNHYRIPPAAFPRGSRDHIRMLQVTDAPALQACYRRLFERTHGLFERDANHFEQMFNNPQQRVVGVEHDGALAAYLAWTFEAAHAINDNINNMQVSELVYHDGAALGELCAFLHTQSDQINRVVLHTQDTFIHHLLTDPRNASDTLVRQSHETNTQSVGIVYRVTSVPLFFRTLADHSFGDQSCVIRFIIADSFLPENDESTTVRFTDGRPDVNTHSTPDVEVRLQCAHFASLVMGVVPFKHLYRYGLAHVSDPSYVQTLHRLFAVDEPPICMTLF